MSRVGPGRRLNGTVAGSKSGQSTVVRLSQGTPASQALTVAGRGRSPFGWFLKRRVEG